VVLLKYVLVVMRADGAAPSGGGRVHCHGFKGFGF
jgi:hypothetical protein